MFQDTLKNKSSHPFWSILALLHEKTWFIHLIKNGDKSGGITFTTFDSSFKYQLSQVDIKRIENFISGYTLVSIKATSKNSFRFDFTRSIT